MLSLFARRNTAIMTAAVALAVGSSAALAVDSAYLTLKIVVSDGGAYTDTLTTSASSYNYQVIAILANAGTTNASATNSGVTGSQFTTITGWDYSPNYGLGSVQFNIANSNANTTLAAPTLTSGWDTFGTSTGTASGSGVAAVKAALDTFVFGGISTSGTVAPLASGVVIASGTASLSGSTALTLDATSLVNSLATFRWIDTSKPLQLQGQNYHLTAADYTTSLSATPLISFLGANITFGAGSANNSQILINAADNTPGAGASDKTVAFGRVLLNSAQTTSSLQIDKTGALATTFTVTPAGNIASNTFVAGTLAAGAQNASGTITLDTTATGLRSGTLTIDNTATDSAAAGQGSADANDVFTVTGTSVADRSVANSSLATTGVSLGRVMVGTVATAALTTPNTTAADDNNATRLELASSASSVGSGTTIASASGSAFTINDKNLSQNLNVTLGTTGLISTNINIAPLITVSGSESAAGAVAPTTVDVSVAATVVAQRTVTADSVNLGVQHTGASLAAVSTSTNFNSTGSNNNFTAITVNGQLFNSTQSNSLAVTGTAATVAASGTLNSYTVTAEGLAGEGSYAPVAVPYTAQVFNGNATYVSGSSWGTGASANWTDGSVGAAPGTFAGFNADTATFTSGTNSVSLSSNVTLASVTVSAGTTTVASGANNMTISSGTSGAGTLSFTNDGTLTIGGSAQNLGDIHGTNSVSDTNFGGSTVISAGASVLLAGDIRQNSLSLGAGATVALAEVSAGTSTSLVGGYLGGHFPTTTIVHSLTLDPTATLDIRDNNIIIDYSDTSISPIDTIVGLVANAYDGGGWDLPGITSSFILDINAQFPYAIGVYDNSLADPISTFDGFTVPGESVLIKFTYMGDVNLDGLINFDDYLLFAGGYDNGATSGRYWFNGDLNFDGVVDFNDYLTLAGAYSPSNPHLPEPASLSLLAIGAAGLLIRRRR